MAGAGFASSQEISYDKMHTDFMPARSLFGSRARMLLFLAIGVITAVLHHLYYAFLNNKPVSTGSGSVLREQAIASALGNALAYLVNALFSAAIGIAFVQQFWSHLRSQRGGVPVRKLEAISDCKSGIATPSALKAWYYAVWLFVIAASATAMGAITVFVPGSLKVSSANFHASDSCSVNTVNLPNNGSLDTFVMQWFQRQVISQGSYMPPASSCSDACRYNVSFEAPALNCTNITATYDFSSFLQSPSPMMVSPGLGYSPPKNIYNATQGRNGTSIQVATLDTTDFSPSAVECLAYRTKYEVMVTDSNVSTPRVDILSMSLINPVPNIDATTDNNATGISQLVSGVMGLLNGTLYTSIYQGSLGSSAAEFTQPTPIMNSPLLILQNNLWRWTMDMETALPSIMQNISISLLSSQLDSASKVSLVSSVKSTCFSNSTFYVYSRVRLLVTYGVAIAITAACICAGLWAVHRNGGVEESLSFSRLMGAFVNAKMVVARENMELTMDSRLEREDGPERMIVPTN